MENQINIEKVILDNQEKRTIELNSLEIYFNKLLEILEKEWIIEKKTHNWDYSNYCSKFMEKVGELNKQLRNIEIEYPQHKAVKYINQILKLEENHYKTTLSIFIIKIHHFELLKKDADEEEFEKDQKEIDKLKLKQKEIRENINEIITELKYSCKI